MPVDLEAIQRGELSREDANTLVRCAYPVVRSVMSSSQYRADIEGVISQALIEFMRRPCRTCTSEQHAINLFKQIARFRATDHVRREARRMEDPTELFPDLPPNADDDAVARLMPELLERIGLTDATIETVIEVIIDGAGLDGLMPELLKDHVVGNMSQRKFAARYGIPSGSVGRVKQEMLTRIRQFLRVIPTSKQNDWPVEIEGDGE